MERKIGETFEYEGKTLQVKANDDGCDGCIFNEKCTRGIKSVTGLCGSEYRDDKKDVIFVEVKERKIGEVFDYEGKKLKVVKAEIRCGNCFFYKNSGCTRINRTTGECKSSKRSDNESVVFVEITEGQPQDEQPQKLNLCEVLKHCPIGTKFWSSLLGEVELSFIRGSSVFVRYYTGEIWDINSDGTTTLGGVTSPEIILFPSREQRDWTKVKYEPKKAKFDPKTLKPFDRVLVNHDDIWKVDFFSHICQYEPNGWCQCIGDSYYICIPYNDDTKHLIGTKDEAPDFYKYWED